MQSFCRINRAEAVEIERRAAIHRRKLQLIKSGQLRSASKSLDNSPPRCLETFDYIGRSSVLQAKQQEMHKRIREENLRLVKRLASVNQKERILEYDGHSRTRPKTATSVQQKMKQHNIKIQNERLRDRIFKLTPTYNADEWRRDRKRNKKLASQLSYYGSNKIKKKKKKKKKNTIKTEKQTPNAKLTDEASVATLKSIEDALLLGEGEQIAKVDVLAQPSKPRSRGRKCRPESVRTKRIRNKSAKKNNVSIMKVESAQIQDNQLIKDMNNALAEHEEDIEWTLITSRSSTDTGSRKNPQLKQTCTKPEYLLLKHGFILDGMPGFARIVYLGLRDEMEVTVTLGQELLSQTYLLTSGKLVLLVDSVGFTKPGWTTKNYKCLMHYVASNITSVGECLSIRLRSDASMELRPIHRCESVMQEPESRHFEHSASYKYLTLSAKQTIKSVGIDVQNFTIELIEMLWERENSTLRVFANPRATSLDQQSKQYKFKIGVTRAINVEQQYQLVDETLHYILSLIS